MTSPLTENDELAQRTSSFYQNESNESSNIEDNQCVRDRTITTNSISPEQAFIHMIKAMLGTGLLSLPLAFKHSGLYLGLILLIIICFVCLYCMRQVIYAAHYICARDGKESIDFANVMRSAVESGPEWIRHRGYFAKQLVNVSMFIAQLGFCCVYFVFMADNLKDFFDLNTSINLSQGLWMLLCAIPMLVVCSIRNLKLLAPLALAANFIYIGAVGIVIYYFFWNLKPTSSVVKWGDIHNLPLFFGTVMFAFEGVCVILPIENRMSKPKQFIAWNGVLNTSSFVVLAIFAITGFYGYLAVGDDVKDTVTLNLPNTVFYQLIKLMFVCCIMVSYPLQFYVPMERIEKWITRKIAQEKQVMYIYIVRYSGVLATLIVAELIPHLALFIALIGAFAGSFLALFFPPIIDLLISYSRCTLDERIWCKNIFLICFAIIGFVTGTYSAIADIIRAFNN
uniref:Aa_trans domain-containing protein n=1 Tax=Parastrongyloides trichosuri TaxID=131310 RepID=A0A0N4ZUA3_PARTI